jgi:hypothetical protein
MLAEDPFLWYSDRCENRYDTVARDVGMFTGGRAACNLSIPL